MLPQLSFLYECDPEKQTADWANRVIEHRRMYWRSIVSPEAYYENMNYLLGIQGMEKVKRYFDDTEFLRNVDFRPVPIMEKPRNILIDETRKSGIKPYINATDPAAIRDKEKDKFRLQNRQVLEGAINQNRSKIDMPKYKMDYGSFNGNIDRFDEMNLNEQDPSDVNFFFDTHYKLKYVANAQTTVNSFNLLNRLDEDIPRHINDIIAVKCTCRQNYISPATGQIMSKYLQPTETYAIMGNNRDGTDASARGWLMQITIQELLNQLGNAFDFQRDWMDVIQSINFCNHVHYDGFLRGGIVYNLWDSAIGGRLNSDDNPIVAKDRQFVFMNWDDAVTNINYKVYFGYIEWPQMCCHTEKRNTKNNQRFTVNYEFKPTEKSVYESEQYYYFKTKVSHFLATGAYSQRLYGYGDLFHQLTKGQNDEYSAGTISIIRDEGLSAVEVAKIYIDLANYAYYKMLWAIHSSQPDKWSWSLESIYQVAMKMQQENTGTNAPKLAGGFGNAVNDLIEKFNKKHFMLHTYPVTPDGQIMGGGNGTPHEKIPGNLDQLALQLREFILEWAEYQVADKLGIGGIREANTPNPKDGLKLAEAYLKQSRAATGYIPEMTQSTFEHTAKCTLTYIQDIIKYPTSLAYKFLFDFVGQEVINSIALLGDVAAHRQGIFVNSLDTAAKKERLVGQASISQQRGEISFQQYILIENIEDPRLAGMYIAYYEEKAKKQQQQQLLSMEQEKQRTLQLAHQLEMERIDREGQWGYRNATAAAQASVQGKELDYRGKIETKLIGVQAEPEKQEAKTSSAKQVLETKANLDQQSPI